MNFIRQAEVIIGSDTKAISIKDLRITFSIQKSRITTPNKAKIDIYNLNEDTRNQIKNEFTKILVNAGYTDSVSMIFTGNIKNIYHHIDGPDTITEIYAGDGDDAWVNSTVNVSVASTQTLKQTVTSLASTMSGVTIGNLQGLDQGKISDKTITYSGPTRNSLDQLAATYNFDWFITNGVFQTVEKNKAIAPQTQATVISAATSMVGSPTVTELGADVSVFLNPRLVPNSWINIQASGSDVDLGDPYFRVDTKNTVAQGFYIINELEHTFDNRGGDALTHIKSRAVSAGT